MLHPDLERRVVDARTGCGVFATRFIPRGTILWVHDRFDRVLEKDQIRAMPTALRSVVERLAYVDRHGRWILCWDDARYQNHSCDSTTVSVGSGLEIAVRDVEAGKQVTCDYGQLNLTGSFECCCGAERCRGRISSANVEDFIDWWDERAASAFAAACRVPQPLLPFALFEPEDEPLGAALRDRSLIPLPSAREALVAGMSRTTAVGAHPWSLT